MLHADCDSSQSEKITVAATRAEEKRAHSRNTEWAAQLERYWRIRRGGGPLTREQVHAPDIARSAARLLV